jgi:phosphopantothenoylcysteine decarboxylase/phosphopantothenate--cysteine ligase
LHRADGERSVRLAPGKDLLAGLTERSAGQTVVAFAAETEDLEARGRRKMDAKGADLVVVNDVGRPDTGFDAPDNEVILLSRGGAAEPVSRRRKREVAERIWDAVLRVRRAGAPVRAERE